MARYRKTSSRRRSMRRRRNPGVRRKGALVINGRRRRRTRRKTSTRRRTARRNGRVMTHRRRTRRNGRRRTSTRRRRTSTRRRRTRRNGSRRRMTRRVSYQRKPRRRRRTRRNGRTGTLMIRKNPAFLNKISRSISKLPFIGKPLGSAIQLAFPAVLGAVSVYPTTLAAQFIGRYVPNMNSSLFYGGVGILLAGIIASTKFLGAAFHRDLAIATAAGAGAVALYKLQTGTSQSMAAEVGTLMVRSPLAGLGTLLVGRRQLGGYGPSMTVPMGAYRRGYVPVR